jgi:hypothetical protein
MFGGRCGGVDSRRRRFGCGRHRLRLSGRGLRNRLGRVGDAIFSAGLRWFFQRDRCGIFIELNEKVAPSIIDAGMVDAVL